VKKTFAITLAIAFVLAFAAPVFAQNMDWDTTYNMDGTIDIEKQVGHLCNTGASLKQTVEGEGEMTKVITTSQVEGVLTVDDMNDWVTAEDAVNNLTVTSVIELCAPAKHVYTEDDTDWPEAAIPVRGLYPLAYGEDDWETTDLDGTFDPDFFEALTDQIWAVQVEADPGFSGGLTQDFEAAYGPWSQSEYYADILGADEDGDKYWWFEDEDGNATTQFDEIVGVGKGDDYVGNYFNIDQMARTSQGTTKRYIDISSPWSHAYLMEDMEVVGMAEIEESFEMDNLEPGPDTVPDWWDLF